jgi:hypothetical protein
MPGLSSRTVLEQRSGRLHVSGEFVIEVEGPLGQPHGFGAGHHRLDVLGAGTPLGDLGDLLAGQGFARVDAQIQDAKQRGERVDGRRAL